MGWKEDEGDIQRKRGGTIMAAPGLQKGEPDRLKPACGGIAGCTELKNGGGNNRALTCQSDSADCYTQMILAHMIRLVLALACQCIHFIKKH